MGTVRIDIEGLVAFAFKDREETQARRMTALFSDPWRFGLHPHHPFLVIPDARAVDWSRTSLPVVPNRELSFDLAGWDISVLPDGRFPETPGVSLPNDEETDPDSDDDRVFGGMELLLSLDAICGGNRVKDEYYGNPSSEKLMSRMAFVSGTARTVSDSAKKFEDWEFVVATPPFTFEQKSAPCVAWTSEDVTAVQLFFRSLKDPTSTATVQLKPVGAELTRARVTHTCIGDACGELRGLHVPVFYDMVKNPGRRPMANAPQTKGGYCPPSALEV